MPCSVCKWKAPDGCDIPDDEPCPAEAWFTVSTLEVVRPCPNCRADMDGYGALCPVCGYVIS